MPKIWCTTVPRAAATAERTAAAAPGLKATMTRWVSGAAPAVAARPSRDSATIDALRAWKWRMFMAGVLVSTGLGLARRLYCSAIAGTPKVCNDGAKPGAQSAQ